MRALIRRKYAMAKRVLDFSLANPSTDPGYAALVKDLQALVEQGQQVTIQQQDGYAVEHGAVLRRQELRDDITDGLRHLVAVATRIGAKDIQLSSRFTAVELEGPNASFIAAAKLLLQRAGENKELLVNGGVGESFLDDLTKAIAEYDLSIETAHTGRRGHTAASAALREIGSEAMMVTGLLDGFNRSRYRLDRAQLAAWESARNVAGPFTVHDPVPVVTEPAPAPLPVPAPAPVVTTTAPDKPAAAA